MIELAVTVGMDIGPDLIKIAVLKKNKIQYTQTIEINQNNDNSSDKIFEFFKKSKINPKNVNVLVKDYKTKRINIERLKDSELNKTLVFEREEKLGTNNMLGSNYVDSHIIQGKTDRMMDILLTVVNDEEIKRIEAILDSANIKKRNLFLECYLYNEVVEDDSVIIDIGNNSFQVMFFDDKKVMKTNMLKKGLKDIIAECRNKVNPTTSYHDILNFSFEDKQDPLYPIIFPWINMILENIVSSLNSYVRENAKSMKDLHIYYTGGLFCIPNMIEYANYFIEVNGRALSVMEKYDDPLLVNSIALAYKSNSKGVVNTAQYIPKKPRHIGSALLSYGAAASFAVFAANIVFNAYQYERLNTTREEIQSSYNIVRDYYQSVNQKYQTLYSVFNNEEVVQTTAPAISQNRVGEKFSEMLNSVNKIKTEDITIQKLSFNQSTNSLVIEGTANSYTAFGVFVMQLRKMFQTVDFKKVEKQDGQLINYGLECKF
jgi:cell division ATPase FtsA